MTRHSGRDLRASSATFHRAATPPVVPLLSTLAPRHAASTAFRTASGNVTASMVDIMPTLLTLAGAKGSPDHPSTARLTTSPHRTTTF